MSESLLLDEHYSDDIAKALRESGYDVIAIVALPELRGQSDGYIYQYAAENRRRVVTENVKDFRPLMSGHSEAKAALLLIPSNRFPRRGKHSQAEIVSALKGWLEVETHPQEDWLTK